MTYVFFVTFLSHFSPRLEAARREAARVAEQQRREAEEQRRKEQDGFVRFGK